MASKSSSIISVFRRLYMQNVMEPFQPRLASAFAASIHTAPVTKWRVCDYVLPRMIGAGNLRFESPANSSRNYARKVVSDTEEELVIDKLDDEEMSAEDLDDEIDVDSDDEVDEFDDAKSDEE